MGGETGDGDAKIHKGFLVTGDEHVRRRRGSMLSPIAGKL